MSRLKEQLERIEKAEDLFSLFELPFDPKVMRIHRLHIMKRFSLAVQEIDTLSSLPDDVRWNRYATALKHAHDYYADGAPRGEHVFFGVQQGLVKLGTMKRRKE